MTTTSPIYFANSVTPIGSPKYVLAKRPLSGARVAIIGDSIAAQHYYRVAISSITATGGVATCTTSSSHQAYPGCQIYIANCNEFEFNGFKTVIDRTSSTVVTFSVPTNASSSASGSNLSFVNEGRFHDRAWFETANSILGHPFELVGVAGMSGAKLAQIARRFNQDILTLDPDICFIQGGVNDIANTTAGQETATLAAMKPYMTFMIESCINNGILPIVVNVTAWNTDAPNTYANDSAARREMRMKWNEWLREICMWRYREAMLFDLEGAIIKPTDTTGAAVAANLTTDYLHLSAYGGTNKAGSALASLLSPIVPHYNKPIRFVSSAIDSYDTDSSNTQVLPNPLMASPGTTVGTKSTAGGGTGTNTGTVPDYFTIQWTRSGTGTVVNSTPSRSDGFGNDWQFVIAGAASGDAAQLDLITTIQSRFSSGDIIVAEMYLDISGVSAPFSLNFSNIWAFDGAVYTSPSAISASAEGAYLCNGNENLALYLRTRPFTIPTVQSTGLTTFEPRLTVTMQGSGGLTGKISRWTVRKITATP